MSHYAQVASGLAASLEEAHQSGAVLKVLAPEMQAAILWKELKDYLLGDFSQAQMESVAVQAVALYASMIPEMRMDSALLEIQRELDIEQESLRQLIQEPVYAEEDIPTEYPSGLSHPGCEDGGTGCPDDDD